MARRVADPRQMTFQMPVPMMSSFVVVPFSPVRGGGLARGATQSLSDRDQAILAASKMSRYRVGVMVIEQEGNPIADVWGKPRLIARFGRVPQDDALAA